MVLLIIQFTVLLPEKGLRYWQPGGGSPPFRQDGVANDKFHCLQIDLAETKWSQRDEMGAQ